MRLDIVNRFHMQWENGFNRTFSDCDIRWFDHPGGLNGSADCTMFMWCNEDTINYLSSATKTGKWIVFIRRFEYYQLPLQWVPWDEVDAVIMVNDALAYGFEQKTGKKAHVIYNAVSLDKWTYLERGHGKKIGMVGYINHRKNLPLAAQIMTSLPRDYELHVVGEVQTPSVLDYILHHAYVNQYQINFHGPSDNINEWMEDKNYLLCTSTSEGCPNSVLEAMAKGIKPIIHNWVGARNQFGGYVFDTINEVMSMLSPDSPYESAEYRMIVEQKFGLDNFKAVRKLVDEVING